MIIDALLQTACKAAGVVAVGISGIGIASAVTGDERLFGVSVSTIRELGSFGLVAVFVLGILWAIKAILPKLLEFLATTKDGFLNELKETRTGHAEELRQERISREAQTEAFREMLRAHRGETVAAIKEQTGYVADLVKELKGRPCQKINLQQ
jgi:hypothetical protein